MSAASVEWDCTADTWGNSTKVRAVRDGGQEADFYGWHPDAWRFKVGDTLIIRNGTGTTRYLLESVRLVGDPRDMWFGTASFFPRPAAVAS